MTLDEFDACVRGWNRAQGQADAAEISKSDYDALASLADAWNGGADG